MQGTSRSERDANGVNGKHRHRDSIVLAPDEHSASTMLSRCSHGAGRPSAERVPPGHPCSKGHSRHVSGPAQGSKRCSHPCSHPVVSEVIRHGRRDLGARVSTPRRRLGHAGAKGYKARQDKGFRRKAARPRAARKCMARGQRPGCEHGCEHPCEQEVRTRVRTPPVGVRTRHGVRTPPGSVSTTPLEPELLGPDPAGQSARVGRGAPDHVGPGS